MAEFRRKPTTDKEIEELEKMNGYAIKIGREVVCVSVDVMASLLARAKLSPKP